jgi:hypothetical protein
MTERDTSIYSCRKPNPTGNDSEWRVVDIGQESQEAEKEDEKGKV